MASVEKYTDVGRMYHGHLRDVDQRASSGKDVVLGQAAARISDAFLYMHSNGAEPLLVFEYERDQHEPLKYINQPSPRATSARRSARRGP